ncbi:MAG: hypothetical protein K2Q09_07550 [Phycisphaerales bacterium]|nr:hypothetical protein [Phycisphaerales bacterium]
MVWMVAGLVHVLLSLLALVDIAERRMTVWTRAAWWGGVAMLPLLGVAAWAVRRRSYEGAE